MRTPTALSPIALLTVALSACSHLQVALPQDERHEEDQGRGHGPR